MRSEELHFRLNVIVTTAVFLATCLALPVFAMNPIISLIGAVWLVATCVVTRILEYYNPREIIEKPVTVASLGFFSERNRVISDRVISDSVELPLTNNL